MTIDMVSAFRLPIAAQWDYSGLFIAGAILIGLMLVGAAGVLLLRRRLRNVQQALSSQMFTLDELRQLHRQGLLSDDEYERAKEKMVQSIRAGGDSAAASQQTQRENLRSADGSSSS